MFDEDKRYKIVICDDDETFIDLLSEKIEQDFVQRKIVCLIEKYSDSRKLLDLSLIHILAAYRRCVAEFVG